MKAKIIVLVKIICVYAGYFLGLLIAPFIVIKNLPTSIKDSRFYGIIFTGVVLVFTIGYHFLVLKIFGRKDKLKNGLELDKKWFIHFISSIGFAAILILAIWFLAVVFHGFNVQRNELNYGIISSIIILFIRMLLVGFQEEIITRGTLAYVGKSGGKWFPAIIISLLFSVTHGAETINAIFYLNLFLFSILVFQLTWISGNIWPAAGFHFSWNFVMGGVFGVSISGTEASGILISVPNNSKEYINGGIYGLEGSIFCTLILMLMILLMIYIQKKRKLT
jgi:uncharacterized protein